MFVTYSINNIIQIYKYHIYTNIIMVYNLYYYITVVTV